MCICMYIYYVRRFAPPQVLLTDHQLREMGIRKLGARNKILNGIQDLRQKQVALFFSLSFPLSLFFARSFSFFRDAGGRGPPPEAGPQPETPNHEPLTLSAEHSILSQKKMNPQTQTLNPKP